MVTAKPSQLPPPFPQTQRRRYAIVCSAGSKGSLACALLLRHSCCRLCCRTPATPLSLSLAIHLYLPISHTFLGCALGSVLAIGCCCNSAGRLIYAYLFLTSPAVRDRHRSAPVPFLGGVPSLPQRVPPCLLASVTPSLLPCALCAPLQVACSAFGRGCCLDFYVFLSSVRDRSYIPASPLPLSSVRACVCPSLCVCCVVQGGERFPPGGVDGTADRFRCPCGPAAFLWLFVLLLLLALR